MHEDDVQCGECNACRADETIIHAVFEGVIRTSYTRSEAANLSLVAAWARFREAWYAFLERMRSKVSW